MSPAKALRYLIAGLLALYVWRVLVPTVLESDAWNRVGLALFLLLALGLAARSKRS